MGSGRRRFRRTGAGWADSRRVSSGCRGGRHAPRGALSARRRRSSTTEPPELRSRATCRCRLTLSATTCSFPAKLEECVSTARPAWPRRVCMAESPFHEPSSSSCRGSGARWRSSARWTAERPSAARRGYGPRWRQARASFLAQHPLCAACRARGRVVQATVVDHVVPHRGDQLLFWDESNWSPSCKLCHDGQDRARGSLGLTVSRPPGGGHCFIAKAAATGRAPPVYGREIP